MKPLARYGTLAGNLIREHSPFGLEIAVPTLESG
jgi:hypothetical protein